MIKNIDASQDVLVIGGGIIGAMSAWELSQAGCQVTILERSQFGMACSRGNCGYISPSHILPLAQPGAVQKTLKEMLRPNSPFAVKPRFSPEALKWFWRFTRRCNREDMLAAAEGIHSLLQSSLRLYKELIEGHQIQCQWEERGNLFVWEDPKAFEKFGKTEQLLREKFGVGATCYPVEELVKLEPAIKPVVAGAWYYQDDCHLRPDMLMSSLREKLEARGVKIVENVEVRKLRRQGGQATAAVTSQGDFEARQYLIATGAWTPFLNSELGCNIPIQPGKGYSLTMPAPRNMPRIPIIFEDTHVAITPMQNKYRIGSTMEFVGYDTSIHPRRLGLLKESAQRYLHDPFCDPIEEQWFGWRPMTWDSKPIIDRSPALQNAWICAGHSMLGISTATGSARLMREMILKEKTHLQPEHFSIQRFRRR
jgi:D-amino-acid dehydrogenase